VILPRPWEDLQRDIKHCTRCDLCRTRTRAVPGQGALDASLMFVGEAPGSQEDLQGKAFVGPAGKLLTSLLAGIDVQREEVFITNVLKCRPPGNRNPSDTEIERCMPYLRRQVSLMRPRIICTLGSFAFKSLVDAGTSISRAHGRFFPKGRFLFFATYHPAAALRQSQLVDVMARDFDVLARKWRSLNGDHDQSPEKALDR
jgi:DNA polymerase